MPIQPTTQAPAPKEFVNYFKRALIYRQITRKDFDPLFVGNPGSGVVSFPLFADRMTVENLARAVQYGQITSEQINDPSLLTESFGGPAPSDFVDLVRGPLVSGQFTGSDFGLFWDTWDPYTDFYLSPTASGWTGAVTPSSYGSAWGYYAANVNGFGFPTQIGSYFTPSGSGSGSQSLYPYSDISPLGPSSPTVINTTFNDTGFPGLPAYRDNQGWLSSLARFPTPWYPGAPNLTNAVWLQGAWLNGPSSEGIAPVLVWKAPATAQYRFVGKIVAGNNQPGGGITIALVDSLSTSIIPRTVVSPNASSNFDFVKNYTAGDVLQFQVGTAFQIGAPVGLNLKIAKQ